MRIIARLDIKRKMLIKSLMFEGVRSVGCPQLFSDKYYNNGIDELILVNNTGSLYSTKLNSEVLKGIRKNKFLPITGGGGITSVEDVEELVGNGCDKIVINSIIHKNISEAKKIINLMGSSSVIGAIQVERKENKFITLYEMAREETGLNLKETIKKYKDLGVGELLISDVNRDGCYKGLNKRLLEEIKDFKDDLPLLLSGGFSKKEEIEEFASICSGLVISSSFHFNKVDISELLKYRNEILNNAI